MSVHKDCGEQIRWVRRAEDPERFMPPLEYAGEGIIITGGDSPESALGSQVHVYKIHRCDPDTMEEWQRYCARMADLKGQAPPETPYQMMRERDRESAWEEAIKKPCPKCGVPKKVRCKSLGVHAKKLEKQTGEVTETRWPHPERWTKDGG